MSADADERRFDDLFSAHHADVLAYAMRRIDGRAAAEDVVSETFATAWRRRTDIPQEPLGWLYAIAKRVLANERRSGRRRTRLVERLFRERGGHAGGSDPALLLDRRSATLAAFGRLTEGEREILMIVAWEGADVALGSVALDCTPTAFRVRLHRARRALERELEVEERAQIADPAVVSPSKEMR